MKIIFRVALDFEKTEQKAQRCVHRSISSCTINICHHSSTYSSYRLGRTCKDTEVPGQGQGQGHLSPSQTSISATYTAGQRFSMAIHRGFGSTWLVKVKLERDSREGKRDITEGNTMKNC